MWSSLPGLEPRYIALTITKGHLKSTGIPRYISIRVRYKYYTYTKPIITFFFFK